MQKQISEKLSHLAKVLRLIGTQTRATEGLWMGGGGQDKWICIFKRLAVSEGRRRDASIKTKSKRRVETEKAGSSGDGGNEWI